MACERAGVAIEFTVHVDAAAPLGGEATFGNGPAGGFVLEAWVRRDDRTPA